MRRLLFAVIATASLAGAGSLASSRAEAMPAAGLAAATPVQAEQVRLVCRRVWNGFAWVRSCYEVGPRYYAPRYYAPRYYAPRGYYRPRYYGYY